MHPQLELLLELQDLKTQRQSLATEDLKDVEAEVFDLQPEQALKCSIRRSTNSPRDSTARTHSFPGSVIVARAGGGTGHRRGLLRLLRSSTHGLVFGGGTERTDQRVQLLWTLPVLHRLEVAPDPSLRRPPGNVKSVQVLEQRNQQAARQPQLLAEGGGGRRASPFQHRTGPGSKPSFGLG